MNSNTHKFQFYICFLAIFLMCACGSDKSQKSAFNCEESPDDPLCITEKEQKEEEEQIQAQEEAKFKSIGDCLKAKKAEAGVGADSKPTPEMLQQCIQLQS